MTIEVRQLLIKATVESSDRRRRQESEDEPPHARLRNDVVAECKLWLEEKLQGLNER